jgi:hypothetical protein
MSHGAAGEWRGFQRASHDVRLLQVAAPLAARLRVPPAASIATEDDTYLLVPGLLHNFKLRRGALEVKELLETAPGGYSLWEDKRVLSFPLEGERLAYVWNLLPGCGIARPKAIASVDQLFATVRAKANGLSVVPVRKHRVRLDNGAARIEVGGQELPRGFRLISYCADGRELQAVREMVAASGAEPGSRVMSWVEFLHEAIWWVPSLEREDVQW